jgi:glycosyltransferase involved in cell wall biosynthesis
MKICFLAKTKEIHTERWINFFSERGHDVTLIATRSSGRNSHLDERVHIRRIWFPPHSIARYGALLEIIRIIREIQPDIIHAHYISHFGILAGIYKKISGFSPIVLTAWGSDIFIDARGIRRLLVTHALQSADLITCDGESLKEAMIKLGADSQKIRIITHGVDTQKFKPESKSSNLFQELAIPNLPLVISTRMLEPLYNVETLIKAIPLILNDIQSVVFVILGDGKDRQYLKNLTRSLDVESKVLFRGKVLHDDLAKYLSISDIYVSTSLSDSTAVSNLEAMACGLAPIVTDIGDNRRWINDGQNGFIVPIKDPKILAEKIILLLREKELRRTFGIRSRAIIEEKSDYYQEMAKMEKIYSELIARYKV